MRTPVEIIAELATRIRQPESHAVNIDAAVRFDVSGERGGSWVLQLDASPSIKEVSDASAPPPAACTFRLSSADFVSLFEGKLTGQQLFFDGRLEVDGDLTLTLKLPALTRLLRPSSKEIGS